MQANSVSVAWRDRPFDGAFHRKLVPLDGAPTIAEVLERAPGLPRDLIAVGQARINGELIPREWWHRVRPRSTTDSCITLHMPLLSGGGGGGGDGSAKKNPLATIATIGVLLAATALSAGALGPAGLGILGASFGAGGVGAAVLAAATGICGELKVWS
jgi:hypothetical protein